MSEDIAIGGSCPECGHQYGEHSEWCSYNQATTQSNPLVGQTMDELSALRAELSAAKQRVSELVRKVEELELMIRELKGDFAANAYLRQQAKLTAAEEQNRQMREALGECVEALRELDPHHPNTLQAGIHRGLAIMNADELLQQHQRKDHP